MRYLLLLPLFCFTFSRVYGQLEVDTSWIHFNKSNSPLPENYISDVEFDDSGNAWLAVWGGGLVKLSKDRKHWKTYDSHNSGLENEFITQMAFDQNGILWLGTDGDLTRFDGKQWNLIHLPATENIILSVAVDPQNNIWIGTYDQGLYRYDGRQLQKIWGGRKSMESGVNDIAFDQNGNVWIATRIGILKYDTEETWTLYNAENSNLINDSYYQIAVDGKNRVWAATYPPGNFSMYDGEWHNFSEPRPVGSSEKSFPGNYIYSMYLMSDHQILSGSQYHGALAFFDAEKQGIYKVPTPLKDSDMGVSSVEADRQGNIWVGSWKNGLFILDNPEPKVRKTYLDSLQAGHFEMRKVRKFKGLDVEHQRIEVEIYDNRKIDGDIVSLSLNGHWIVRNYELKREPLTVELWLKKDFDNYLILHAENLGRVPPNTAALRIIDGNKKSSLILKSDFNKSGALMLRYRPSEE